MTGRKPFLALVVLALAITSGVILYFDRRTNSSDNITSHTRFLMDTLVEIKVGGGDSRHADRAISAAFDEMERIEDLMSAHRPNSDVSRINVEAGQSHEGTSVSRDTIEVLRIAQEYRELSGGEFDITIGPIVELWGIGTGIDRVPTDKHIHAALGLVNGNALLLNINDSTVRLGRPMMRLDLGAIAKGYAVDVAMTTLRHAGVRSALINAGSSTIAAMGLRPDGRPWKVGLSNPGSDGDLLGAIDVSDVSIGTSGISQRYFEVGGVRYHHILSPKTGYPAKGIVGVTVLADKAVDADALSTTLFLLGPDKAMRLVKSLDGVEAHILAGDGEVLKTPGFPPLEELQ